VEDHDAGERFGGVRGGVGEGGGFDLVHDGGGGVADVFAGAVVFIIVSTLRMAHTVPPSPEVNRRVVPIGLVCERYFQEPEVVDNGGGDGGNEEENAGCEEEEGSDVVEEAGCGHFGGGLVGEGLGGCWFIEDLLRVW